MATRFTSLSRLMALIAAKPYLSRSYTSLSLSASPLLHLRPLTALSVHLRRLSPSNHSIRSFATRHTSSSLNDPNPNWSNRPPKETILLDGCDFEHWLVVVEPPKEDATRDEIIDSYIKTLAQVVGSEEEARMKIYSVSTKHYFAFGALVSEELSYKLKELPGVRWVLPDSYLDVRNKDYGGEPFINGQAVPYDPKYHAEWVRNNARANERNRRNDRPRNNDRSRNFERRRENLQNQNQGYQTNQGGPNSAPNFGPTSQSPSNVGPMPPNNMRPPNMGPNMMMPNMGRNNAMPNNMGPNNAMPNNMGPNNAMPSNMGPNNAMPSNMGPSNTMPNNMGSSNAMPNNMGSGNAMPNNMGPSNAMPNNMGPNNAMPNNMGPSNAMPNNMGPSNAMPNNMGPSNAMPNNMGPSNAMPNNMGPRNGMPNNVGPSNGMPNYTGRMPQNMGYQPNNMGGVPNNAPNYPYRSGPSDGGPQYQNRDMRGPPPQQNREFLQNYDPNVPVGNNNYQPQNVDGRDMPL